MSGPTPRPVIRPAPDHEALSSEELIRRAREAWEQAERDRIRQRERQSSAAYQAGFCSSVA